MTAELPKDAVLTAYAKSLISFKARELKQKREFRREAREDLEQDLTAYLLSRAHLFDPRRASLSTFADRVIRSGIAMMLRDRRRKKRAPDLDTVSLEQTGARSDEDAGSLRNALTEADLLRRLGTAASDPDRAELIAAVIEAVRSLPAEERELCRRIIERFEAPTTRGLGLPSQQLHDALERIRKRFEAAGLGDS